MVVTRLTLMGALMLGNTAPKTNADNAPKANADIVKAKSLGSIFEAAIEKKQ